MTRRTIAAVRSTTPDTRSPSRSLRTGGNHSSQKVDGSPTTGTVPIPCSAIHSRFKVPAAVWAGRRASAENSAASAVLTIAGKQARGWCG
jgi:hypothetical protein